MKKTIFYMMAAFLSCIAAACSTHDSKQEAKKENAQKFDSTDIKRDALFAVNAADANLLEIKAGKLAQAYATTDVIKSLGKMIVDDHTKAGEDLHSIAAAKNITLQDSLSSRATTRYNDLAAKRNMDFDKAFVRMMVSDHKDAIDLFQKEVDNGNDSTLAQFARNTIPTLQHHLAMSDSIENLLQSK